MASEFGLTTRGSCLLAAGATAVLCGVILGQVDLTRAGVLALAVPVIAMIVVRRSRIQIANRRRVAPEHAQAGEHVLVHLTITNRSRLPIGTLMLEDRLPDALPGRARFVLDGLAGREARTVTYRLGHLPRGRYRTGPLQVRLTDPFHLVDLRRGFAATTDFVVRPRVDPLPPLTPALSPDIGDSAGSHSIGTHGADDASTREYHLGDPLRKIHWRSTARLGTLMVRQEERPWQGRATVLLDLRQSAHEHGRADGADHDPRQHSSLEWAVSAAASIGWHLTSAGRAVELISDLSAARPSAPHSALGFVEELAAVRADRATSLTRGRAVIAAAARESALVAVLGNLDAAGLRLLAGTHPPGVATPALALLLDVGTWAGREPAGEDAARVLRAAGWRVAVVRRGADLGQAWREVLRADPLAGAVR